ncbi:MAG: kinase-like domain-containing protein, partial [Olpidium bornovanus]
ELRCGRSGAGKKSGHARVVVRFILKGYLVNCCLNSRSIADYKQEAKTENTAGQSVLRGYFGNETYKSLQVTTETTAAQAVSMILEKMMIKDSAEGYGIFEVAKDGIMRHLLPSESPFEVMRHWQGGETFMFKKVTSGREAETSKKKLRLPVKRAAKLAGFFGVDTGADHAQAATVPPAEFSELLSVLNAGKDDQLDKEITESRQRTVQVRNKGKVSKEGWLYLEGVCEGKPAHLENCWCQIKNNVLLVQTNVSKNESVAPDRNNGISVPLDQCVVDGPAPSASHPGKFRFTVTAMRGKMEQIFVATTQADAEAWVSVLQAAVKSAKNNMSLADFEFHKVLGRGQYGKVLLCSQHSTSKVYAVKVLDKVAMASDSGVCGVPDNVILEGIKHPFIVTLHCAFETEERLYMVMEYVNGGELFFHVSKFGRFPEVRVQVYCAEIFLALQYLHKNDIVYRDVKLENLMLSKDGHLKIAGAPG